MWTKKVATPQPPQPRPDPSAPAGRTAPGASAKTNIAGAMGTAWRREEKGFGRDTSQQHPDRHWLELGTGDAGRETWGNPGPALRVLP